jgi:hypothetical protein
MATKIHGSIRKQVTPLAMIDADSPVIPIFANRSPAPDCIRICGVKYKTALIPENCTPTPNYKKSKYTLKYKSYPKPSSSTHAPT